MATVFLSYRRVSPDEQLASQIYRRLSNLDHDVFFDRTRIAPGSIWVREIERNVERADWFVVLVSSTYVSDASVILQKEVRPALRRFREGKLRIVPVNVQFAGELSGDYRELLADVQWLPWRGPDDTAPVLESLERVLPAAQKLVKGLRAFSLTDAKGFATLGREREIDELSVLIQARDPLLAVHGESGAGKSSLLAAGIAPRIDSARIVRPENALEPSSLVPSGGAVVIADQFERWLIRAGRDAAFHASLSKAIADGLTRADGQLVLVLRDEYRTALETMLPDSARRVRWYPVTSFGAVRAAAILERLLAHARIEYDGELVRRLCRELVTGTPPTVAPALLQLIAQRCEGAALRLDEASWDRMRSGRLSVFEAHLADEVVARWPRRIRRLDGLAALAALTAGEMKSSPKTLDEIARRAEVEPGVAAEALEAAAFSSARVVRVSADEPPRYELEHDLFAAAIFGVRAEEVRQSTQRRRTRRVAASLAVAGLVIALLVALLVQARGHAAQMAEVAETEKARAERQAILALSDMARAEKTQHPQRAVLIALEALARGNGAPPAAVDALREALAGIDGLGFVLPDATQDIARFAVGDGAMATLNRTKQSTLCKFAFPSGASCSRLSHALVPMGFSADDRYLVFETIETKPRRFGLHPLAPGQSTSWLHAENERAQAEVSKDGRWVLVVTASGTARLWDLTRPTPEPRELPAPRPLELPVKAAFDRRGELLGVIDGDTARTTYVWQLHEPLRAPESVAVSWGDDPIWSFAVSKDWLAVAFAEDSLHLTGRTCAYRRSDRRLLCSDSAGEALEIQENALLTCYGRYCRTLRLDSKGDALERESSDLTHVEYLRALDDDRRLTIGSEARRLAVRSARTGQTLEPLIGHEGEVRTIGLSPSSKSVAVLDDVGARVWRLDGTPLHASGLSVADGCRTSHATSLGATLSNDGRWMITCEGAKEGESPAYIESLTGITEEYWAERQEPGVPELWLWRFSKDGPARVAELPRAATTRLAFSNGSRFLAGWEHGGDRVALWRLEDERLGAPTELPVVDGTLGVTVSPDERWLFVVNNRAEVLACALEDTCRADLRALGTVGPAAPDTGNLIVRSARGGALVWAPIGTQALWSSSGVGRGRHLSCAGAPIQDAAVTHDGRWAALIALPLTPKDVIRKNPYTVCLFDLRDAAKKPVELPTSWGLPSFDAQSEWLVVSESDLVLDLRASPPKRWQGSKGIQRWSLDRSGRWALGLLESGDAELVDLERGALEKGGARLRGRGKNTRWSFRDGAVVAEGDDEGTAWLLDGAPLRPIEIRDPRSAHVDAKARRIVQLRSDANLELLEMAASGEVRSFAIARQPNALLLGFAAGAWFVTEAEGRVYAHPLDLDALERSARIEVGRNLTREEWKDLFGSTPYRR
ncbi:MAG TPA: TIR domain-containing protein, partial [Polyangiaceae bacterium]